MAVLTWCAARKNLGRCCLEATAKKGAWRAGMTFPEHAKCAFSRGKTPQRGLFGAENGDNKSAQKTHFFLFYPPFLPRNPGKRAG
jgi:hypothetical protein